MWVIFEDGNNEDIISLQVILTNLEVSGEVILGYLFFSWLVALAMAPEKNPLQIQVLAPLD